MFKIEPAPKSLITYFQLLPNVLLFGVGSKMILRMYGFSINDKIIYCIITTHNFLNLYQTAKPARQFHSDKLTHSTNLVRYLLYLTKF